jgi:hypothetical protein
MISEFARIAANERMCPKAINKIGWPPNNFGSRSGTMCREIKVRRREEFRYIQAPEFSDGCQAAVEFIS